MKIAEKVLTKQTLNTSTHPQVKNIEQKHRKISLALNAEPAVLFLDHYSRLVGITCLGFSPQNTTLPGGNLSPSIPLSFMCG